MQRTQMTEWEKLAVTIEQQDWRELAASIAITVITLLKQRGMTKQQLADRMGVKAQYISRVVKGNANLTLDTIAKLGKALGEEIISISDPTATITCSPALLSPDMKWSSCFPAPIKIVYSSTPKRQPKMEFSNGEDQFIEAS